jgi:hypothetical protein
MACEAGKPVKTCVECGKDCTGVPRVRDRQGRYYCRDCYERRSRSIAPAVCAKSLPPEAAVATAADRGGTPLAQEGEWLTELASKEEKADGVAEVSRPGQSSAVDGSDSAGTWRCPNCEAPVSTPARICDRCGFDFERGIARLRPPAHSQETESRFSIAGVLEWCSDHKLLLLLLFILVGSTIFARYAFRELANPDAGPFTLEFSESGDNLQLKIPWNSPWLPTDPQTRSISQSETDRIVSGWFILLPDGRKIRAKWIAVASQHSVELVFDDVPKSTDVTIGVGPQPRYEVELRTPAIRASMKVTLRNLDK